MSKAKPRKTATKKTGRPAGSKNKKYVNITETPTACPACQSTELKVVPGSTPTVQNYHGHRTEWHPKICECGQHIRVRLDFPRT